MAREVPGFLKDFLAMRKALPKVAPPPPPATAPALAKPKKTRGTKDSLAGDLTEASVAKIIEDKPPKKEVMDYFQKECDRLTAEKI